MALYMQSKSVEAESQFEESLKLNPNYAKSLNAIAYINLTMPGGNRSRAESLIKQALKLEPNNRQFRQTYDIIAGDVDKAPKTSQSRPDAIAVIIGNKSYKSKAIPSVKFAIQDAAIMKKYLVDSLGFDENNVFFLQDATNLDMMKYFGNSDDHKGILYNKTRKDRAEVFIFYSGHGAPDTNTKKAYLIPTDADPGIIKLTGYSLDTLYENIAKLGKEKNPKSITIVMDACFSGASNDGMIIENASPIFIETSSPALSMKNAVIFSSSKGNQISSWYTDKNHGLFTYFFLKGLKESVETGRKLTAGDMEKMLTGSESVNDYAWRIYNREQEPQVIGDKNIALVQ
jgi:uncharacterized caspase-like protein